MHLALRPGVQDNKTDGILIATPMCPIFVPNIEMCLISNDIIPRIRNALFMRCEWVGAFVLSLLF